MTSLRHQLPVYSPISLRATLRAAGDSLVRGTDARPALSARLARDYSAERVVLCGSGTQALQLALGVALRGGGHAGPVALPAYSCFDVASAAVGAGVAITLYDLDPETLAPDLASLERALERGARVAVVSPLYGLPVDWEALEACAARYSALLVEDAAQGHGAAWRARPLGSLGQLSVLSFGRGKGWTGGRGGALLLRGPLAAEAAEVAEADAVGGRGAGAELGNLGGVLAQWLLGRPALYGLPASLPWLGLGQTHYREPAEPQAIGGAAAALIERHRVDSTSAAAARRGNARRLLEELPAGVAAIRPHPQAAPGYLRLPVRLARGMAAFPEPARALRLGIAPGYPATLAALPAVQARLAAGALALPGAERLVRELVTLPTHGLLTPSERVRLLHLLDTAAALGRPGSPGRLPAVGTRIAL